MIFSLIIDKKSIKILHGLQEPVGKLAKTMILDRPDSPLLRWSHKHIHISPDDDITKTLTFRDHYFALYQLPSTSHWSQPIHPKEEGEQQLVQSMKALHRWDTIFFTALLVLTHSWNPCWWLAPVQSSRSGSS